MKEARRLDHGDRRTIQDMLDARERLCRMAEAVLVDPTSASREMRRSRAALGPVAPSRFRPAVCDRLGTCERRGVCGTGCASRCRGCADVRCEDVRPSSVEFSCDATERFPRVCNGRRLPSRCPKDRCVHRARDARRLAAARPSGPRRGVGLGSAGAALPSEAVAPLVDVH